MIKELIERVKLTPKELSSKSVGVCYRCPDIEGTTEHCRECRRYMNLATKAQLNKVLNDPDLALIEDCECGGNGYEEKGDSASSWHVVCGKCADTGRKVTPLREAIKEATNEHTD